MNRKTPPLAALALAGALTFTGCFQGTPTSTQTTPAVAPTTDENDDAPIVPTTNPDELTVVATEALTAYLDKDSGAWFDTLSPYLTDDAKTAYGTVLPANIPDAEISGEAEAGGGAHVTQRTVTVPTTIGTYTVELERADSESNWLVASFGSPE
jgi:hypothetical protein